ncbi:pilus assembly protein TadE [Massilia sp. GER05]|uniref:pilus assembly protein TadG-related protein n=1 Tax=Massilia sp. GER05 TaxID=3394605 RepID=UPI003F834DF3
MPSKRNTSLRSPGWHGSGMPSKSPRMCPPRYRQGGAFAIMAMPLLLLMIGICALALDLGQIYNRKVDLNGFAKNIALAAAHELNGTSAGIAAARAKAKETAESLKYQHFNRGTSFAWNDAALTFSTDSSRTGTWVDGSSPSGLYFAKVDTSALDPAAGQVNTFLIWILPSSQRTVQLSDSAIAGRKQISVTPIGVCAMDSTPAVARTNTGTPATELVEYGFRRGISYDLMQLNPNGTSPVRYLINPVIAPGVSSSTFDTSLIGPFICTGAMWVPRLSGGAVRVSPLPSTSPLADLSAQLNTRFDDFSSLQCGPYGAPPDYNIKAYAYGTTGGAPWMVPTTGSAAAMSTTARDKLETIADLPAAPAGTTAGSYGPLWTFAKAAKYPSYVSLGSPEPATGYSTFSTSDWTNLYKLGPTASGYPSSSTPYAATGGANYRAPSAANRNISTSQRRVLNIPLLSCPVPAGSNVPATVLGIGKFFMTVPATANSLIAEFAGTLAEQSISSQVEIYP